MVGSICNFYILGCCQTFWSHIHKEKHDIKHHEISRNIKTTSDTPTTKYQQQADEREINIDQPTAVGICSNLREPEYINHQ